MHVSLFEYAVAENIVIDIDQITDQLTGMNGRQTLIICALGVSLFAANPLEAITPPYTISGMFRRSPVKAGKFHEIAFRRNGRFLLVSFDGKSIRTYRGRYRYKTGQATLTLSDGGGKLDCSHQVNKAAGMRMYWSCDLPGGGESDFKTAKTGAKVKIRGRSYRTMRLRVTRVRTRRAWIRTGIGGRSVARLFRGRNVTTIARTITDKGDWCLIVFNKRKGGLLTGWVRASALR